MLYPAQFLPTELQGYRGVSTRVPGPKGDPQEAHTKPPRGPHGACWFKAAPTPIPVDSGSPGGLCPQPRLWEAPAPEGPGEAPTGDRCWEGARRPQQWGPTAGGQHTGRPVPCPHAARSSSSSQVCGEAPMPRAPSFTLAREWAAPGVDSPPAGHPPRPPPASAGVRMTPRIPPLPVTTMFQQRSRGTAGRGPQPGDKGTARARWWHWALGPDTDQTAGMRHQGTVLGSVP